MGGGAPHALPQEKDFKIFVNKNAIKRKNSGIPPPDFLTTPSTPLRTIWFVHLCILPRWKILKIFQKKISYWARDLAQNIEILYLIILKENKKKISKIFKTILDNKNKQQIKKLHFSISEEKLSISSFKLIWVCLIRALSYSIKNLKMFFHPRGSFQWRQGEQQHRVLRRS